MYFRVNFEVRSGYGGPFLSVSVRSGPFLLVNAPGVFDTSTEKSQQLHFIGKELPNGINV